MSKMNFRQLNSNLAGGIIAIILSFSTSLACDGQELTEPKIAEKHVGFSIQSVFEDLEKSHEIRFFFLDQWVSSLNVSNHHVGYSVSTFLNDVFEGSELDFILLKNQLYVILKDPTQDRRRRRLIENAMERDAALKQLSFGTPERDQQVSHVLSGIIVDEGTGERIPLVNIQVDGENVITAGLNGFFQFEMTPGRHILTISHVDHDPLVLDIELYESTHVELTMSGKSVLLDEIIIEDTKQRDVLNDRIGETRIEMRDVQRAPAFLGQPDLVKQVQFQAGVTTVGEAAAGYNVRGGGVDQNLILYDGLPIFNGSHVFGFFSSFNPEVIQNATFYKGGIPSQYGGRLSSVLDIESQDGNYNEWSGTGGIGMITTQASANGPIKKDVSSISMSARSTYSDWLVHSVRSDFDLSETSVGFYDASLNYVHKLNARNKISFSGYSSRDSFSLSQDTTYNWSNLALSVTLNREMSDNLSFELVGGISSYGYRLKNEDRLSASQLSYRLNSTILHSSFELAQANRTLNFGWQLTHYRFQPGRLEPLSSTSSAASIQIDKQYSLENALYASIKHNLGIRWETEFGLRVPLFSTFGPAEIYQYESGQPREVNTISDTVGINSFESVKSFLGFEPRVSLQYSISDRSKFKIGLQRVFQNLHLVTNTTSVTPIDIWQPSGYYFKPQRGDQVSAGLFHKSRNAKFDYSIEGFYKFVKNVIDFKDGAELTLNNHLETELVQGTARSYGLEASVFKNTGRLTGNLNYTYSRAFRTIAGSHESTTINDGKEYPANFDQPHIFNLAWNYRFSRRHFFTGNFTYHTGRPITVPLSAFKLENTTVAYFSERNQYRIPDYHRLDIALVIEGNHKVNQRIKGTWVFSIYNLYARKNPYSIFFRSREGDVPKPYRLSIIGTFFPSVTYKFNIQ